MACSIFPSLSSFSTLSGWQIQGRSTCQKGYDWLSWSFVFLGMELCVASKFWVQSRGWPLQAISSHKSNQITSFLLWVLLSSHSRLHWNLVLMGCRECNVQTEQQEWQTHILCISSPILLPILCCLGYYSFIGKLKVSYCQSSDILFQGYFDCYRFCAFP